MKAVDAMMKMKRFPDLADPMRFQEMHRERDEAIRRRLRLEMPSHLIAPPQPVVMRDVFGRFTPPVDPTAPEKKPKRYAASAFSEVSEYMLRLRKRGFEEIGRGAYSTVFTRPGWDKVLKVCRRGDDKWPAYAKWCHQTKSPHAIRVYSIKHHEGFYVAIMEKVKPATSARNLGDLEKYIGNCRWEAPTRAATSFDKASMAGQTRFISRKYPRLPAFLRLVRHIGNDLHYGNWGVRDDGTPVIFDPVTENVPRKFASKFDNTKRFRSTGPRA